MSAENDDSHNIIDSNNDDDDDDEGEAADMEEFEESGMLEMVDPVSLIFFSVQGKFLTKLYTTGNCNNISSNQHTGKETNCRC